MMKQGRFEISRQPDDLKAPPGANAAAVLGAAESHRKRDWLLVSLPVLVLLLLAATVWMALKKTEEINMPKELSPEKAQTLAQYQALAQKLEHHSVYLTLRPDHPAAGETEVFSISPMQSCVRVDLAGLEADLWDETLLDDRRFCIEDAIRYVSIDRAAIRTLADQFVDAISQPFEESFAAVEPADPDAEDGKEVLRISRGQTGRTISREFVYWQLLRCYFTGELTPSMVYQTQRPKLLKEDRIWETFCKEPKNARLNESTFAILPEENGYGVERETYDAAMATLGEGETLSLPMVEMPAAITAQMVEASLFQDVLAEVHTPHSWIDDRTVNLILACRQINGKILMPGDVFSFNATVGQRTAEKGYRKATAYIGGASVPEIGGGVCQVASSIYYAVLKADLRTTERHVHTYLVTYVPKGMDAAIYWGQNDYRFQNNSPYPIKILASVSDGNVNITLRGTEWKNYSVKLYSEVVREIPYETRTQLVTDGSASNGEVIVTPYTGYVVNSYRTKVDRAGNSLGTNLIATSNYNKRDRVIAQVPAP